MRGSFQRAQLWNRLNSARRSVLTKALTLLERWLEAQPARVQARALVGGAALLMSVVGASLGGVGVFFFPLWLLVLSAAVVFALLGAALGYLAYLRLCDSPERRLIAFHKEFRFDENLGLWTHVEREGFFCPACKSLGRESRMATHERGFLCASADCGHLAVDQKRAARERTTVLVPLPPSQGRNWR